MSSRNRFGSLGLTLLLLTSSFATARAQTSSVCATWTTLSPNQSPFARANHACVYDSARDRMLVFGGNTPDGTRLDEVWALSLSGASTLTQIATQGAGGAIGAAGATAIYDPVRDRLLVFGGYDPNGSAADGPGTVYQLDLSASPATWSVLTSAGTAPPNRVNHTAVYDASRDRMVVFGGATFGGTLLSDVWALSLSGTPTWTQLTPGGTPPSPRSSHVAIYDAPRDQMVIWGGKNPDDPDAMNDVMALSFSGAGTWSLITTAMSPPVRFGATAIADLPRDRMVIFSGLDEQQRVLTDTWSLSLTDPPNWTRLFPTGGLPYRPDNFASIYDPVRQQMVASLGDEFWSLGNLSGTPAWSELNLVGEAPLPRAGATVVYDSARQQLVLFGGTTPYGTSRDLWRYAIGAGLWSRVPRVASWPIPREDAAGIYDSAGDRMMLFGGNGLIVTGSFDGQHALQNDTWQLARAGTPTWTKLTPTGTPPASRSGHAAILDLPRNRMILFAGSAAAGSLNDAWSLSLAGGTSWSQLSPTGTPPPVPMDHSVSVFDAPRDRMITYGNNGVWALGLVGTPGWSQISTSGTGPAAPEAPSGAYDPTRQRLLVAMGVGSSASYELELSGTPTWYSLFTNTPAARGYAGTVWDAANDRMLVVAGGHAGVGQFNDVQALSFPSSQLSLIVTPAPATAGMVQVDPALNCYAPGAQVTLTAVPGAHSTFSGWSGDASGNTNPLTVTMNSAKNITAKFLTYTLMTSALPPAGGTIMKDPDQPSYSPGQQVTLTATADPKYAFRGWFGDASGTTNPLTVTMDSDKNISAQFLTYSLVTDATPSGTGTIARNPDQTSYAPGTQVTLTALGSYTFLGWSGDASGSANPLTITMDRA